MIKTAIITALYAAATIGLIYPWGWGPAAIATVIMLSVGFCVAGVWGAKHNRPTAAPAALAFVCSPALWWGAATGRVVAVAFSLLSYLGATWALNARVGKWVGIAAAGVAAAAYGAVLYSSHLSSLAIRAVPVTVAGSLLYLGLAAPWIWLAPVWGEGWGANAGKRTAYWLVGIMGVSAIVPLFLKPGPTNYLDYALRWGPALGVAAACAGAGRVRRPGVAWGVALAVAAVSAGTFLFAAVTAGKLVIEAAMRQGAPRFLGIW